MTDMATHFPNLLNFHYYSFGLILLHYYLSFDGYASYSLNKVTAPLDGEPDDLPEQTRKLIDLEIKRARERSVYLVSLFSLLFSCVLFFSLSLLLSSYSYSSFWLVLFLPGGLVYFIGSIAPDCRHCLISYSSHPVSCAV